mmetsp:Transcript_24267/g.34237  ORF Transcript_24267/g.34237 Transcript_24267/m.34237 type:complete len:157 (-) Transcript_24267:456-926(-)|eukprot:CAMPEP_0175091896 /NCGR_PEP_ID=MMETSP0086_2-20121207/2160_1 /TAXON_ID=136419 /ORGANISM="Unknown Unknown, Strain D1" /LENGTH=156 /DNA_ID=CAMNT_0016364695 /DNA_START=27 /DNA_END=497 /DNA_ORIENTATION=-
MADIIGEFFEDIEECFQKIDSKAEDVDTLIGEVEDSLQQIRLNLSSVTNPQEKQQFQDKIRQCEVRLQSSKKSQLLSGANVGANDTVEQKQAESLDVLEKARAQLLETEQISHETIANLTEQTQTIKRANQNLKETNQNLSYSNKLVNKMSKWWRG